MYNEKYLDPSKIKWATFDPEEIEDFDQAIDILQHLGPLQRTPVENVKFQELLDLFGLEESTESNDLTPEEKFLIASDFLLFLRYMFRQLNGFSFKDSWVHRTIANRLMKTLDPTAEDYQPMLIINMPPRIGKTEIVSIYFPAYVYGLFPDSRNIGAGYSGDLQKVTSAKIMELIEHPKYTAIFPNKLDQNQAAKEFFKVVSPNASKGEYHATSVGGKLTGVGAGLMARSDVFSGMIIVDDPLKADSARSDAKLREAQVWFSETLKSRPNNRNVPIIVVMQRLALQDVSGYLLGECLEEGDAGFGREFELLKLPAILTKQQLDDFDVPDDDPSRLTGDEEADEYSIWPFRFSLQELRDMRDADEEYFDGQYQQIPPGATGSMVPTECFLPYDILSINLTVKTVFIIDTASTTKTYSDYNVILVAHIINNIAYIRHIERKKAEMPELLQMIIEQYNIFKPSEVHIEYKSAGIGAYQLLKDSNIPLKKITRDAKSGCGDKITRTAAVTSYIKTGHLCVPNPDQCGDWLEPFLRECKQFPFGTHDDMVDALTDLLTIFIVNKSARAPDLMSIAKLLPMTANTTFQTYLDDTDHELAGMASNTSRLDGSPEQGGMIDLLALL